ncbi:MAG: FlgO family outer membrane protein, partial [Geobacter sp.]
SCNECATKTPDGKLTITPPACSVDEIKRQTVLVTYFVDLKSYIPGESGLLLGEFMRGSLSQVCCYKIVQAEFGRYFKLNENGLVSLTRRISEVKQDDYPQPEAVVGTYNYLNNSKVALFVRRINTTTGHVTKMVTREIDYSCIGRKVVYDVR